MRSAASLRARLVLLVGILVGALSAPLLFLVPTRMEAISREWAESRSVGIARLLASASEPALDFDDHAAAQALLENLSSTRGATWAALLRGDGTVLARWRDPPAAIVPCLGGEPQVEYQGGLIAVRIPAPSRIGQGGTLALAFDLEELRTRAVETRRFLSGGAVLALLAGVSAAFGIGTFVIRPLRRMERVAERIAQGDLTASGDLQTGALDEAGALARAFQAMLEKLYQQRSALARANEDLGAKLAEIRQMVKLLASSEARTRSVIESALDGIVLLGRDGKIEGLNAAAEKMFGTSQAEAFGQTFLDAFAAPSSRPALEESLARVAGESGKASPTRCRVQGRRRDGREFPIECNFTRLERGSKTMWCAFVRDLTEAQRLQMELHQAQKLEAVGRLASGIAHEINTPIQYIGDNTRFLEESFAGVWELSRRYAEAAPPEAREALRGLEEELDLEYLREEVPRSIQRTLQGVERVATIVRAMKEFAHPDRKEMVATDLNRAIMATLEIARNEYKYVADVEPSFGELPLVKCYAGDLNQVLLNIVINAAHAIGDAMKGTGSRGKIRITTRREADDAVVAISDDGTGIPEAIRDKVFDPFFTTKEVGRGTGQGLAIARSIIAKHQGSLGFESKMGKGTTFLLRIPIEPRPGS
jgi:two-component system, NtrC family, sensor kinase